MLKRIVAINPNPTAPTALIEVDTTKANAKLDTDVKWAVSIAGCLILAKLKY